MFPNLFSSKLGASPLFQPVFSLSIDQDISLRPCFSYAPNFCAPSLNLLFAVSAENVSSHQYKDLRPFPIIMRKRKFFSHHHTSESLYLIPTFNLSLAKQSERSRFFILFEILFPAFCKSKFLHIFGRFKPSARKVNVFHVCREVCHKLFPLLAAHRIFCS